jgi:hypothetical protein
MTDFPITSARLAQLYAFWNERRGGRAMPSRRDMEFAALKPWLGNLTLVSVIDGGRDYHIRVHGTNLREIVGQDLTGRYLKALPHEFVPLWTAEYDEVVRTRAPVFTARRPSVIKTFITIEKLILPLSADGLEGDTILYGVYPLERVAAAHARPPDGNP